MRKLIRSKASGAFLSREGGWTRDLAEAADFTTEDAYFSARHRFHLQDCEIYYSFEDRRPCSDDFTIPLF